MNMELKHLAPYLPYRVEVTHLKSKREWILDKDNLSFTVDVIEDCVIILRPLSQLTEEIEHNGERFVPLETLSELIEEYGMGYNDHYISYTDQKVSSTSWIEEPYFIAEKLLEWHFDVFGLIQLGQAVKKENV